MSSGSDAMSEAVTKDQWTVHDIDELKQKFSDWLDDTVERLGGERKVSSRVEKEGKLHFKIHDVVLTNPRDTDVFEFLRVNERLLGSGRGGF